MSLDALIFTVVLIVALWFVAYLIYELYAILIFFGFLLTVLPPALNVWGWQPAGQFMTESFLVGVGFLLTSLARIVAVVAERADLVRGDIGRGESSLAEIKEDLRTLSTRLRDSIERRSG